MSTAPCVDELLCVTLEFFIHRLVQYFNFQFSTHEQSPCSSWACFWRAAAVCLVTECWAGGYKAGACHQCMFCMRQREIGCTMHAACVCTCVS